MFSEEIDDAISGYALGITFIAISALLLYHTEYFPSHIVSCAIGIAFGSLGVIGCGLELSKSIKLKGMDNLTVGFILLVLWYIGWKASLNVWINIAMFFVLIIGTYGFVRGGIELIYSLINSMSSSSKNPNSKTTNFKNAFLLLTQVLGFVLTILNILQIIGIISNK